MNLKYYSFHNQLIINILMQSCTDIINNYCNNKSVNIYWKGFMPV